MTRIEVMVSPNTPMPKGYGFLKKGWPYKTALCRRETHAANKPLYVVKDKSQILGLRAPKWIIAEVGKKERTTRDDRKQAVARRDDQAQERFRQAVKELYRSIPDDDAAQIASWALRKRSGRVGRTSTLPLDKKAHLAVAAHARHRHTDYEEQVRQTSRNDARRAVLAKVKSLLAQWQGEAGTEEDPILLDEVSSESGSESEEDGTCTPKTQAKTTRKSPSRRPARRKPKAMQPRQRGIPVRSRDRGPPQSAPRRAQSSGLRARNDI